MSYQNKIYQQFPLLQRRSRGKPLVYLDSGATSQKPSIVIDAIKHYYEYDNANVHRGVYELGERATALFEKVRDDVQHFINASARQEIIFTRGTTDAINLVATSLGSLLISKGDEIVISTMEHHSNIVPWQMLCERTGAHLKVIRLLESGLLDLDHYQSLLTDKTKLVAVIHLSNVLGCINPIKEMVRLAHAKNIAVLVDGAQAVPRIAVDVQDLDCDFYVFSAHKMYGPTGLGVLYAKHHWLEAMPPYQGGGDMISRVTFAKTEYNVLPYKFEAGTPNIAAVMGLGAAIEFMLSIGLENICQHERDLTKYAIDKLSAFPGIKIYGDLHKKLGVISFTLRDIHPHDMATILDNEGIAVRAGHHCAMPLMDHYQVPAMARASFGIYSRFADIDALILGLYHVLEIFGD